MVSLTMAPINPLSQITTTSSSSLLCPCRQTSSTPNLSRSSSQSSSTSIACSCRPLSFQTDSLPVRNSSLYSTSYLPTPSHAYNLRSSSSSHSSSTTNASIPALSPTTSPSPPFSFTTSTITVDNDSLDYYPFPLQDTALDQSTSNALGVNFNQSDYINNNSNTWFGSYLNNSTHHPIETLLNSDIAAKNNACQDQFQHQQQQVHFDININAITDNGQHNHNNDTNTNINNTFENTFFQQLQGFKRTKKVHSNMPASSSPQTPRDGAALFSSFNTTGETMNNSKSAAAEFDFDMLAASFLNDQVAAFESSAPASTFGNNTNNSKITENFFANLPLIGSPLGFASNMNSSSPTSAPLLQNAFRTFSNANNMVDGSQVAQSHFPPRSTSMSSSNSSSISPNLASPAFDASIGNFPFSFAGSGNGINAAYNTSPNYSGIDTPALVMDDGNDLSNSLTTSPMWGQLDLGSISLFPQQQQHQLANVAVQRNTPLLQQQNISLPTISPKELDLPLPEKNINTNDTSFNDQVGSASYTALKSNNKRVRESPAFGDDEENDEDEEGQATSAANKKARRITSSVPASASASASATAHFNGTRHTSSAALPLDAPTQPRTYKGPESKTSKRAVPAAAARKVAAIKAQAEMMKQQQQARRSVSVAAAGTDDDSALLASGDIIDDDQVEEVIEMSIEAKRRQNTIAARRSRQRKAEHLAGLEETIRNLTERVNAMENEKMVWMMRAIAAGWSEDSRSL